jgi:hypothetical protein
MIALDQRELYRSFELERRIFTVKNESLYLEFEDNIGYYKVLREQG